MRGIGLAVDGVERAVIGRIVSEESVAADFVRVQAYRGTQRRHCPTRGKDHCQNLRHPVLQWNNGPRKDHLRNKDYRHKANSAVVIGCNGRNGQTDHQPGQGCQAQRDIGFHYWG